MCRLFGLISNKPADIALEFFNVHRGIQIQSLYNPHGWGFGWYNGEKAIVYKEAIPLYRSPIAKNLALRHNLKTDKIISHVRLATEGRISIRNTHPFKSEKYLFAHNGHIDKKSLYELIDDEFRYRIKGETDSEVYFYWLIQHINEANDTYVGLKRGLKEIIEDGIKYKSINFVMSDGRKLYAFRGYRINPANYTLYFLKRNPEDYDLEHVSRETGMIIKFELEKKERVSLISSEKLTRDEDWKLLENNTLIEIDPLMRTRIHFL